MTKWIPISECMPEVNGEYLVTVRGLMGEYVKVEILYYAEDLYKIDEFDFIDKQGVAGWYSFDGEWGYCEVDNVVAWMPQPKPYKAERHTCGECQEWGTVNCSETYREPTKNDDICESFKAESEE